MGEHLNQNPSFLIAMCDNGAWPLVRRELRKGHSLIRIEVFARYALDDGEDIYGPTLSAGYVFQLQRAGLLRRVGPVRFKLGKVAATEAA